MSRGAAVVHGNTAYFSPRWFRCHYTKVYSYQNILGKEQWSQLPDNPNRWFGLAVIDGLLTSVGGYVVPLTLSSVSQEKVRGNNGLRSSLPCLHHVSECSLCHY